MKPGLFQLHTEPIITEREWTVEEIPVLTATISIPRPVPPTGSIPRRIYRFYSLQARSYLRYCERWLFPQAKAEYQQALASSSPLPCFRAELAYHVTYNEGGLWSLYTQSREVTWPGQTLLTRRGDTWDLSSGYPVAINAFFPQRFHWKRSLLSLAAREIECQERAGVAAYHTDWRRKLRRHLNPRSF